MSVFPSSVIAALSALRDLIFPQNCIICGNALQEGTENICLDCMMDLPLNSSHETYGNDIEKRLWSKERLVARKIEFATSYLLYDKGNSTSKILHSIKYHGNQKLAIQMGRYFARELKGGRWDGIDCLIPVPLHPKKFKKRGYNQSECICDGLSDVLGKPTITDVLVRNVANETQTKKNAQDRWANVQGIFSAKNTEKIVGMHIAIVDDVLTTGATIEACIAAFDGIKNIKISVLTLASTSK